MKIDYPDFDYIKARKSKFRIFAENTGISVAQQLQELQDKALKSVFEGNSGIYVFHSTADDFTYIGSSENLEMRRTEHIDSLRKNEHINGGFQMLYFKYGLDNFSYYIMEFCPPEKCLERESKLILECDPEINIARVKPNTLGLGIKSMNEQQQIFDEWFHTEEGFEWKRKGVLEWASKGVGRSETRKGMINRWEQMSSKNMTDDEKVDKLLYDYKPYLPTKLWEKEALIKYLTRSQRKKKNIQIGYTYPIKKTRKQEKEETENRISYFFTALFILTILFILWLLW